MASDWITWDGGDCPVPAGTPVEVRYRDGEIGRHKAKASSVGGRSANQGYWDKDNLPNDIVAYRVFDPKCEACDMARCDECVPTFPKDMKIVETSITPEPASTIEVTLGCCRSIPCEHPGIGPCDMPVEVTAGGTFILPPDDHRVPQPFLTAEQVNAALDDPDPVRVAADFLDHAKRIQQDRAKEYEQAGGERSTARVVAAFNAITGRDDMGLFSASNMISATVAGLEVNETWPDREALIETLKGAVKLLDAMRSPVLRESEGWLFLQLLKMVRGESKRVPHMDSIYDNVSYAALYGEARSAGR